MTYTDDALFRRLMELGEFVDEVSFHETLSFDFDHLWLDFEFQVVYYQVIGVLGELNAVWDLDSACHATGCVDCIPY